MNAIVAWALAAATAAFAVTGMLLVPEDLAPPAGAEEAADSAFAEQLEERERRWAYVTGDLVLPNGDRVSKLVLRARVHDGGDVMCLRWQARDGLPRIVCPGVSQADLWAPSPD